MTTAPFSASVKTQRPAPIGHCRISRDLDPHSVGPDISLRRMAAPRVVSIAVFSIAALRAAAAPGVARSASGLPATLCAGDGTRRDWIHRLICLIGTVSLAVTLAGLQQHSLLAAPVRQDAAAAATATSENPSSVDGSTELYFEKHVRPILKVHCFLCHGEEPELAGGLDLRLVRRMVVGGDSGPAVIPHDATASLLMERVAADEMPPGAKKLTGNEKQILEQWIQQGATTRRPEPDDPNEAKFTDEELEHWAFQPLQSPTVPGDGVPVTAAEAIDRFIAGAAHEAGYATSPMADRRVLIRRLSFNLTGLPPTPEQIAAFLADDSDDGYARVVEQMLASPHYGERWGRHWLDVAGYAESEGQVVGDRHRPHAWRYRDYVVEAFNRDLPYDQFVREQLAGDQMIDGVPDPNNNEHARLLAATGFLQMAPDVTQVEDSLINRNQAVADTIQTVTSALLGLTVACAQCHDHRYDPITIEDYYRLRAVFDPAMPIHQWQPPGQRLFDMTNDETKAERARIEAEAVAKQEDINARRRAHCQTIQDREIAAAPEAVRDALRQAVNTPAGEQSAEQKALLEAHPKVRTIDWIVAQLVEYDGASHRAFQAEEKQVAALRETKPLDRMLMAVKDRTEPVTSHVLFRGDPQSPHQEVVPGEIEVLTRLRSPEVAAPLSASSNRRLAYANQLTDGTHPLTARVIVNRIWQHHFGQGLVRTPGEFGLNGQRPSHPELLDYLAKELIANGWSLKWLQRQIVSSRTFQQASALPQEVSVSVAAVPAPGSSPDLRDARLEDPDNRYVTRMSLRRLDAEAVRDAILSVSGQLNSEVGGPSVPVAEDDEGKAVIGTRLLQDGLFAGIKDAGDQARRRSLYLSTQRSLQLNLLQTFDLPEMKPNCQQRSLSTVTPQALLLMNDSWVVQAAQAMSERLWQASSEPEERLRLAYELAFASEINAEEIAACQTFITGQAELFRQDSDTAWQQQLQEQPEAAERRAWASLCQMLMASNRFLYLE